MLEKFRISILFLTIFVAGLQITRSGAFAVGPDEIVTGNEFGEPLKDITATEFELFRLGMDDFTEVETADEGLGPLFNGRSCAQCHSIPAVGGSSTVMEVRAGVGQEYGAFEELFGNSLYHMFSIPPHRVQNLIPQQANVVAHRKSVQLFGAGLIEAIPDEALLALEDAQDRDGDGVSGRAHRLVDKASGQLRIGRFGWKAQQATLLAFGAEAYRDEMGITNALFPDEVCPGGDCDAIRLVDAVRDPEDRLDRNTGLRGIDNFENFMRLLGPPPRAAINAEIVRGEQLFQYVGCHSCHVPSFKSGPSPVKALSFKQFFPYGDFLLHDIGTGDGIRQGEGGPEEIRTPPLWGVRFRAPFLHNGSAPTIKRAIEMHRAEAESSRERYERLSQMDKDALFAFLNSL
ncbi:MAG: hypothetical protein HY644_09060 [Acidobacteria bacterium]|nr:hypothetical protein [Acidobacteriota bacterium]